MEIDFSNINLQYLISLRDIAREDPEVAAPLLGITPRLATLLAQVPGEYMSKSIEVKIKILRIYLYTLILLLTVKHLYILHLNGI